MCLAVPLKIIAINEKTATCESMGLTRDVRIDFIREPQIGDYVIVHAGFAIEKLGEEQALQDIEAWKEVENAIQS